MWSDGPEQSGIAMKKIVAAILAMGVLATGAHAQSPSSEKTSTGIEAINTAPQTWWVYIRDKTGIVVLYPPDGKSVATTDQFEELISSPVDASAGPTIVILGGSPRPSCVGPFCPSDAVLQRLQALPDVPAGSLVLRGTAVKAVFFERR
jgi:hypothetical protein